MAKITDNEIMRDAIELFLVNYAGTIDMAGTVKYSLKKTVNYFSINLEGSGFVDKVDELNKQLTQYLITWMQKNHDGLSNYMSLSHIVIEYLRPNKDGMTQNLAKSIALLHLPPYYFQNNAGHEGEMRSAIAIWALDFWNNVMLRNAVLITLVYLPLLLLAVIKFNTYAPAIQKAFDYTNVASSIIGSLSLAYLTTKAVNIRQEKLARIAEIKTLSNKLTYFRKLCYNFQHFYEYWNKDNPYKSSFDYANGIKTRISSEEFFYPNYSDREEYAKYRALSNENFSGPIINMVLQLHMFAGEEFSRSGLAYTAYPADYIYSFSEIDEYITMHDANHIWYCCDEKYFPEQFPPGYYPNEIMKEIKHIDKNVEGDTLTRDLLSTVSLNFQYDIIPRLYRLTRLNEAGLPRHMQYFLLLFILILTFGIVLPATLYIFLPTSSYALLCEFIVLGLITHVLVSLPILLQNESTLDRKNDY
ncbi:hypothetical protein ACFS5N_13465 [Mucilaginibacter ximonensis]|uniref:Uncharacterized protein n=1 Tax=Mucilaginibacter ximonensis TaxID=538021 RepID=A0ABW5YDQ7_9SPHI